MSERAERALERPRSRRRGCALTALSVAAWMIVGGVWALEHRPGEDWWPTALLTYGPQVQWIAPAALMLLVTAIARRPLLSAGNCAAALFALFCLAGWQITLPRESRPGEAVVRIATWNVYGYTRDRETVQGRILSWDCDIVCLQESARPRFADLLPGWESMRSGDLRIYVRRRITRREVIRTGPYRPRSMALVEAETDAGPVTVMNVHFPRATRSRSMPRQVEPLARYVRTGVTVRDSKFAQLIEHLPAEVPLIVAGDMNTPPTSRYWRRLDAHLSDAFDAAGRGFGHTFVWRRKLALLRIDYLWTGGGARALRCWTEEAQPSDHRPVLAEIALPP